MTQEEKLELCDLRTDLDVLKVYKSLYEHMGLLRRNLSAMTKEQRKQYSKQLYTLRVKCFDDAKKFLLLSGKDGLYAHSKEVLDAIFPILVDLINTRQKEWNEYVNHGKLEEFEKFAEEIRCDFQNNKRVQECCDADLEKREGLYVLLHEYTPFWKDMETDLLFEKEKRQ